MRLVELEDVANGLYLLCLIIGLRLTDRLDSLAFWVFIARVGVVFLTNDVLFPVSYMPDQLGYIRCAMMYRGDVSEWCNIFGGSVTVGTASRIFAYFPMPFLVSVRSISLVNMALVIVFYAFLHKKGFFSPQSRLFYLCYPSFILYSAVGMRDVFILYLMLLAFFFLFEQKRFIVGILFLYPLFLLKPQNAFMALPPFILALLAGDSKKRMVWAVLLGFVFTFGLLLGAGYLEELNKYRHTFFAEDGGGGEVERLQGSVLLPFQLLGAAIGVIFMPFPWQAGGAFQLVQSVENLIVGYILFLYWTRQPKPGMENLFLNLKLFMFSSMMIYGAVIFNFGTAARYRFPFVLLFVLFADRFTLPREKDPKS